MDATVQTPASSPPIIGQSVASQPSLVTQLLREGIELRDIRGDTKTAIERFQEALDSEPNNPAVIAELAKTYDLLQLHDRATEIRRKSHETASSPGAADELADQQLKLGAAFPTAAPIPTLPAAPMPGLRPAASRPPASIREAFRAGSDADVAALDSSAREVRASPYETPSEFAKYAITPREREIDQLPPQPTATASEMSSPVTSASPAQLGPSAETALSQPGGHLIVLRAANFGWNVALNVKIDGKTAGNIVQGSRYDQFVPAGRHVLTVSAVPNYQPTSKVLDVQDGQTYVFTATRQNPDSVVLVPSALSRGQPH